MLILLFKDCLFFGQSCLEVGQFEKLMNRPLDCLSIKLVTGELQLPVVNIKQTQFRGIIYLACPRASEDVLDSSRLPTWRNWQTR